MVITRTVRLRTVSGCQKTPGRRRRGRSPFDFHSYPPALPAGRVVDFACKINSLQLRTTSGWPKLLSQKSGGATFLTRWNGSFANRFIVTRSGKKGKSFGIRKKAECAGKNDRGVPHCGIACPKMQGRCIGGRGALRSFVFGNFVGERLELLKGKCGNGSFLFSLHSTLFVRPRPHERVPPLTH